jgi:hypothetical protein
MEHKVVIIGEVTDIVSLVKAAVDFTTAIAKRC